MAEAKKTEAEASPAPPKSKSKLMLFIIIGVVVVLLAGGGAFFMLKKNAPAHGEGGADTSSEGAKKQKTDLGAPPAYYKFDKAFTVKLQSEQQDAYLQTEVQFRLENALDQDLLKQYEPELKHRITLTLMSKQATELATAAGVQKLANELRNVANQVLGSPAKTGGGTAPADTADPGDPVQSVLFSTFIVQ
ncbi:MAG: flagellar basal body-associated FliL family protein [Burkholderiaceae bacterium]|nr:flagellar basal body-associated FliL family protein [Sulfuritalea sp.]MCF8174120.1 flagellar basal body-associated FliL family protein [Burkholderiaceae bacterium]MCF8184418.1 flagellar basal body-associated FliL family protein [Polynucleobacter sp.]